MGLEANRFHLRHVEIELLGRELQQRGGAALAELDEADEDGGRVIGVNGDPGIEALGIGLIRAQGHGDAFGFLRGRRAADGESDQ